MSNLEKQNKDLYSFIKKVILKYFPYVEDRLYFFDDAKKVPQLDICINFNEDNKIYLGIISKEASQCELLKGNNGVLGLICR